MKKPIRAFVLLSLLAAISLFGAGCSATEAAPVESIQATPEQTAEPEPVVTPSPAPLDVSVIGEWGLSNVKNDMSSLYEVFGTSLRDYGASMEIKSDGQMEYSVGMAGGSGSFERIGDVIKASLISYNEGAEENLELRLTQESGKTYLCCEVYDTTLWWTQDAQELFAAAAPVDTSAYDRILELYRTALSEQYDDLKLSDTGLNYMLMFYYGGDPLSDMGYTFMDVNGDGTPELLVAPTNSEANNMVFDMYTLVNGAPLQIFSSGERDRYYCLSDGTIYNEGSSSAFESVYRQLTLTGDKLVENTILHFNETWTLSKDGSEPQAISEEEAGAMIDGFQSQIIVPEYTPFGIS